MQGVPGSTTQAEFTDGDYIIPKSHPAHLRASQTLHRQPPISLLLLISTPALCLLPYPITPSNSSQSCSLSPIHSFLQGLGILAWTPWCRAGTDTTQATALPQTKLPPLSSSVEFIPWGTCRGARGHQPHTEGETSHVLQNNTLHRAASPK